MIERHAFKLSQLEEIKVPSCWMFMFSNCGTHLVSSVGFCNCPASGFKFSGLRLEIVDVCTLSEFLSECARLCTYLHMYICSFPYWFGSGNFVGPSRDAHFRNSIICVFGERTLRSMSAYSVATYFALHKPGIHVWDSCCSTKHASRRTCY